MKIEELTEEKLKDIKKRAKESLAGTRQELLLDFPFIGNISMHMDLIPVRDKRCRTACTDGAVIYWDLDFLSSLTEEERKFVLAHEVFHLVLLHLTRCQTRNQKVFNIASDMEVNSLLCKQNDCGIKLTAPKSLCFPPSRMEGKSAEVIYEWLMKKMRKELKNMQNQQQNDGSSGKGFSSGKSSKSKSGQQHNGNQSYDDVMNDDDNFDSNDGNIPQKNGSETGKLEGQFDNHKYEGQENDDNENSDGNGNNGNKVTDRWGEVGYDSDFQPKIDADFADRMRERVITEAQRCQRMKGKLPAGLEGILDKIMKPEVNWREQLQQYVTSCIGDVRRYLPPNRRHVYNEMYFQSRRSQKIKVACLIDTSGSCWGDLSKFFTELNSLLKTFGQYELTVIQNDAAVQDIHKYTNDEPFPIDDPKAIEIKGCGGSDFRPGFKALREEGIENEVDCIIAMTDGFIDVPKYPPSKPMLWILTKDCDKNFCDYGKKIIFKESGFLY